MALMPGAQWRPLASHSTSRIVSYDILCWHTMVGSLTGTDSYFRNISTGVNSHFGVGGDGTIYQWVDTAYRSGANLNGNHHIISVETADIGSGFPAWNTSDGSQVPAWTDAQLEANAKIAAWVNQAHGIPLELIPDAKPGRRGQAYHRQGVPGFMVAGAEQWSNATGKVCPGTRRIAQIPQLIARAKQIAGGGAEPQPEPSEEDDMRIFNVKVTGGYVPHLCAGDRYFRLLDSETVRGLLAAGVQQVTISEQEHANFVRNLSSEGATLAPPAV